MKALRENSKDAKVFVLIHKMDTIPEHQQNLVFEERKVLIVEKAGEQELELFGTSIWDETLYQAWSRIAHSLIPRIGNIEAGLKQLCELCAADELVLFEKSTFLEISHIEAKVYKDPHRFEKISNVIKQFKLCLFSTSYQFGEMAVKNSKFRVYLIDFTRSTYLMIVVSNKDVEETALRLNISIVKPYYDKMIAASITRPNTY
eukprot:TRINITY_DN4799_c1_g1_i1.p1 TRINITY_DN4799_c1_g1~~TRINITY_DN4799_c1_g1_i1.p1  ORF type:complete len:203 (-),score=49.34 TRINITY_DN4799_c1_g1_i1:37-645(-)